MAFEKLAVLGVGAIGSTLGAYLTRAGCDISLIDLWPAHVEEMKQRGLRVTAQDEEFTVRVKAVHLADVCSLHERFDTVLLSVKSYDSEWAVKFIEPYLKPAGILVSAQNGINEDWVAPLIGYTRTLGCVVTLSAGLYEPGHVTRTSLPSRPSFALGELNGMITPRVQELVTLLSPVGPAHVTTNLWGDRWAKLTINCMANALAGITGMAGEALRASPDVFSVAVRVAGEALTVAQKLGVQVEPLGGIPAQAYLDAARGVGLEELHRKRVEAGRSIGAGRPSLFQDILKGRRTEVDYLNGYVVRKGREVDVPTPVNQAIVEVTQRLEAGDLKPDPANLTLLTKHQ
ncbi:MAG TPA: 2-dehydropantoate 2-reductase [Candidatus Methylomirabilis sp.]|nr:2-dehydropantoate 2-reductase [Candidatus Methylomirabilis sp.]